MWLSKEQAGRGSRQARCAAVSMPRPCRLLGSASLLDRVDAAKTMPSLWTCRRIVGDSPRFLVGFERLQDAHRCARQLGVQVGGQQISSEAAPADGSALASATCREIRKRTMPSPCEGICWYPSTGHHDNLLRTVLQRASLSRTLHGTARESRRGRCFTSASD